MRNSPVSAKLVCVLIIALVTSCVAPAPQPYPGQVAVTDGSVVYQLLTANPHGLEIYVHQIDSFTAHIPEYALPDVTRLLAAGVQRTAESQIVDACLEGDIGLLHASAGTIISDLANVTSVPQLRDAMVNEQFVEFAALMGIVQKTCGFSDALTGNERSYDFLLSLIMEKVARANRVIPGTDADPGSDNDSEQASYLACMQEISASVRGNQCCALCLPPAGEQRDAYNSFIEECHRVGNSGCGLVEYVLAGGGTSDHLTPTERKELEAADVALGVKQVFADATIEGLTICIDRTGVGCSIHESAKDSPGVPGVEGEALDVTPEALELEGNNGGSASLELDFGSDLQTDTAQTSASLVSGPVDLSQALEDVLLEEQAKTVLNGLIILAFVGGSYGLGAGVAFARDATLSLEALHAAGRAGVVSGAGGLLLRELWGMRERLNGTKLCQGGLMDARLPDESPLLGKTFEFDGVALSPLVQAEQCACMFNRNNPNYKWGCSSEAEKRRQCAENPFGPDDAPKPECLKLLAEDHKIDLSGFRGSCELQHCPLGSSPYSMDGGDCACKPVDLPPVPPDQCTEEHCAPGQKPIVDQQTGQCGCVDASEIQGPASQLCSDGSQPPCLPPIDKCVQNPASCGFTGPGIPGTDD